MSAPLIAVCVSGAGTNLRALAAAERRGSLGGRIGLVLADRDCAALAFASAEGIPTALVQPRDHPDRAAWNRAVCDALAGASAQLVVLAGFMRVLGAPVVGRFRGRIVNVHPSLLPAFPGTDAVGDALAAGVKVTGVTVHMVDEALDGGSILGQEPVAVLPGDDRETLLARLHAVEHRLLPRTVASVLGTAGRPRRALISVSDKTGLAELGRGLARLGFEVLSTGGTAGALRDADVPVTDVAAVTGVAEMLDGRVKTLHPRIAAGILADPTRPDHAAQLDAAGIDPIELVVVNLYPFEAAAARSNIGADELIEEIDIGGPTLVRAAAKNHASVAVVTDPADYGSVLEALRREGAVPAELRRELALRAFARTAAYDSAISSELPRVLGNGASNGTPDPFPERLTLGLRRTEVLRYGENPHQEAALYVCGETEAGEGLFSRGAAPLQGKPLSYNNILDAAAAAALARDLHGAAVVIVKHTNPCGAAESADLISAWRAALAGDPQSAFGGVVAVRGRVDEALAAELASIFLEVVVAAGFEEAAREVLAHRPNLRLLEHPSLLLAPRETIAFRGAGGGIMATTVDRLGPDDAPSAWRTVTSRQPTVAELADLDLAWRVCRHVSSNAIVLARAGSVVGVGAGQMSRVDSARLAVARAGAERARGSSAASDAFFPFVDGPCALLDAGVSTIVQPGGSQRDADVIAAVESARGAMLFTGRRHFRH